MLIGQAQHRVTPLATAHVPSSITNHNNALTISQDQLKACMPVFGYMGKNCVHPRIQIILIKCQVREMTT